MNAVGKIVLLDDGSITVDLPGGAQWCQDHGKWLRIVLGNANEGEVGEPIIAYGEVSSDMPETVFGRIPVAIGEVPDMGAPVFGLLGGGEILERRLAEGFPKAKFADTTGLQDHPLMKRIERKG